MPADPARDDKGRILPGRSLNPKGRAPGIPNRNQKLQRAFDRFRADAAFAKRIAKKAGLSVRGKNADQIALEISLVLAADGLPGMFEHLAKYAYVALTPEAAGVQVVNQNNIGNSYEQLIAALSDGGAGSEGRA